jgi:hypothetical protein
MKASSLLSLSDETATDSGFATVSGGVVACAAAIPTIRMIVARDKMIFLMMIVR